MLAATLRRRLPDEPLASSPIGLVPIVWNNVDLPDFGDVPFATVLDEAARLGYEGVQLGRGFPAGERLREQLGQRGLRLAEVYAALPSTSDGPTETALEIGRRRLAELHAAGGQVLVVALDGSPEREPWAGRATRAERLTEAGLDALAQVLETLAGAAAELGHPLAFHAHAGTFVETPDELDALLQRTDPARVGICLDVGHYTVGGGDPVAGIKRYGERVSHVHLKDVDVQVLSRLRRGETGGFGAAIRERLFCPLGSGILELPDVLRELDRGAYRGWLMVEQDSSWEPASEAAAIGRRVLDATLRWAVRPA